MAKKKNKRLMAKKELESQSRIIDMMLTMHSKLRDVNRQRALLTDLFLLISSGILISSLFVDPEITKFLHINPQTSLLMIRICSTLIFLVSLISLRVNWKQKAAQHNHACEILSRLKLKFSEEVKSETPCSMKKISELKKEYTYILSGLPKIPENKFHSLKALHKRKIELSKIIDIYSACPLFMLRLALRFRSTHDLLLSIWQDKRKKNSG